MFRSLEYIVQDLGFGWRMLRRSPVFTLVAVLSLGLGIGVNTAIFGVIYAVLLEGLPLPKPDQLVALRRPSSQNNTFAYEEFRALRKANTPVQLSAFASAGMVRLALGDQRDFVRVEQVDGAFFDVLGLRPLRGRLITPDDDATGAAVAVISETMWERHFQRRDDALGKTITLNGAPFSVVGITSARYQGLNFPGSFQMAVPLSSAALLNTRPSTAAGPAVTVVGRLGKATAIQPSEAALAAAFQGCCAAGQLSGSAQPVAAESQVQLAAISHGIPGKVDVRGENARLLKILMAGVGIVLLIVCANVGNLLLARASARQRELAVRRSIGAARGRLLGQLCLESLQLALLGGAIGLLFAWWTTSMIAHNLPAMLASSAEAIRFRPKPALLLFTFAVSLVSALLFGVLPALRATRGDLTTSLKAGPGSGRMRGARIDRGIVVAQIALALLLVSCAGLLLTTLRNLQAVDLGFTPKGLLLAEVEAPQSESEQAALRPRIDEMSARLRALPGVKDAALAWATPIVGGRFLRTNVRVPGYEPSSTDDVLTFSNGVDSDYFAALGIPVLRGRGFTAADDSSAARVVIVNAAFVKRYFPARDPLGATIHLEYPNANISGIAGITSNEAVVTIVGVVADSRYQDLRSPSEPLLYQSFAQIRGWPGRFVLTLRTDLDPNTLSASVRDIVNGASPGFRTWRISAMTSVIDASLNRERLVAILAALFGALALTLAAVGVYGVVAFSVTQRTKEIGIRIALGAESRSVLWLVGRTSLVIVALGLLIGAPLAFAASRGIASQLYGIGAHDPLTLAGAAVVLVTAAGIATAVPGLRATRVDPLQALRQE